MHAVLKTRWAAIGAAIAVTLGAGGVSLTNAAISSGERPVYVALDAPCRVVDTRESTKIGAGDANALTVQITGENRDCTGPLAIPADAVAVATNVTVIQPSDAASGRSFFTVYPTGATRPVTSNLNFVNGQAPTPNKVDVGLGAGGRITIYNFDGTAHAAVDIFGYYVDHDHDDRYYTETEVDAKFAAIPTGLTPFTPVTAFTNNWSRFSANFSEPGYWVDADGIVNLQGGLHNGTSAAAFQLPEELRPATFRSYAIRCSGGVGHVEISPTTGNVAIFSVAGSACASFAFLDGITFRPDI